MARQRIIFSGGTTLVETLVAMAVLAIAAIGALGYQYHSARHSRTAKFELTATRTAQLLLEDWKSCGGAADYDPRQLGLGFSKSHNNKFYLIEVDDLPMFVRLMHRDLDHDATAGVTLREISVVMRWRGDHSILEPDVDHPHIVLATYVRLDASGG